jgi:hypothetical protein
MFLGYRQQNEHPSGRTLRGSGNAGQMIKQREMLYVQKPNIQRMVEIRGSLAHLVKLE